MLLALFICDLSCGKEVGVGQGRQEEEGVKAEEESERRFRGNHRARGKEGIVMVTTEGEGLKRLAIP